MRYEILMQDMKWTFQESDTGILDIAKEQPTPSSQPVVCQEFNFDEIQGKATIKILGDYKPSPLAQTNYIFVVHLAKFMAYLQRGVYLKVANWLNKTKIDRSHLVLLNTLLSDSIRHNLFWEYVLGSYEEHLEIYSISRLLTEPPDNIDTFARKWYASNPSFYTRVVGFNYNMKRFIKNINGEELLTIKPNDTVFVIREYDNKHDPNSVALMHESGKKLGYIRRNIARHLAPVMDKGRLYTAKVTAVLALYRQPDEKVHIKITRLNAN